MDIQSSANLEGEPHNPSISVTGRDASSDLDARQAAPLSVRLKKNSARAAAATAKAEIQDCQTAEGHGKWLAKHMAKNRRRAEAETESRERNARRETADKERIKRDAGDKQQEREEREERKREDERKSLKEADEKRRKRHLVGVAWGFDDRAGARTGTSAEEAEGSYTPKGNTQHGKERDAGHCEDADKKRNVWGVEAGGPGPEIVFEFGVPVPANVPNRWEDWKKGQ